MVEEQPPGEPATEVLTGEEAPADVPAEAAERARSAERRVRQQHRAADPAERPISES